MNNKHSINEINSYNSANLSPKNKTIVKFDISSTKIAAGIFSNSQNNILQKYQKITIPNKIVLKMKEEKENKEINSNSNTTISNNNNNNINNNNNNSNNNNNNTLSFINNHNGAQSHRTLDHIYSAKYLIPPADPLLKRTSVPKIAPKFGKMKNFIKLPSFIGEEPLEKFEYKPNNIKSNLNEKLYEAKLYINSKIMLEKLVYLKTKLNKDNIIDLENIVNVKKLNLNNSDDEFYDIYDNTNNDDNNNNNNDKNPLSDSEKKIKNLKPFYTYKDNNDQTLIFESRFESGNLLCAFKTEEKNYQLVLQNDTNTTGYLQWFFFRVQNRKKAKINFNIINLLRKITMYGSGLKVLTYSTKQALKEKIGWHREGENILYYQNNLYIYNSLNDKRRNLYSLSFDYTFKYENDTVYFANCLPFFYSDLMKELNTYELDETNYPFFHRKTLCTTLGGNDLDMITLNSQYDIYNSKFGFFDRSKDKRKGVVLFARQHPGETVGSHVMKGCMDFLMGNSDEAKKLREIYLFKIIPMMNPDGVLVGNSRTSFAGCDLNRRWLKPNEIIHPEIYYAKEMILKLSNIRDIAFIIDFHGHFGAFNSFFYANVKDNKRICSLFPYICSQLSKIISYNQSIFSMPRYKFGTGRITLFNELNSEFESKKNNNNNIVAIETSFFGINRTGDYSRTYLNRKLLQEIGRDVALGMLAYYYKYENIKIDFHFLDIDLNDFENIINENEEISDENGLSESEPSFYNFEKNKIMKLMPSKRKRKRKKIKAGLKKNLKKSGSEKILNISNLDIKLYNPLNVNNNVIKEKPKTSEKIEKKVNKIIINCNNNNNNNLITTKKEENVDALKKDVGTQTEEIFFKMHWSFFAGDYKILQAKNNNNKVFNRNKSENNFNFKDFSNKRFSASKEREFLFNNNKNNNNNNKNNHNNNKNNFLNNYINNSNGTNKFNSLYNKFKTNISGNINNNILSNKKLTKNIPYFIKVNQNNNVKYQRSESTKKIYGSFQL